MKQGYPTLEEFARELTMQRENHQDFLGPTGGFRFVQDQEGEIRMDLGGQGDFGILDLAHRQMSNSLGINWDYYNRMRREAPGLLLENANHWFGKGKSQKRLVRTLNGNVRAYLSDRYRPLDNYDLAEATLPVLSDSGATVASSDITETRMYLKAVMPGVEVEIPPPLGSPGLRPVVVQPGIVISNSEVGMGSLAIQPAIHTLACLNMATWAKSALRKRHLGGSLINGSGRGGDEEIWKYFSDDTRKASDEATWRQVRDLTDAALTGPAFDDIVRQLTEARTARIEGDPAEVVRKVGLSKGLTEDERSGVLRHLIDGGELSKFGLHNAITRQSQDIEDYDRATEIEALGGAVISLTRDSWREVQVA